MNNSDDPSTNAKIAALSKLTRELGKSRTPSETLSAVRLALREMYGPVASLLLSTRGLAEGEYRVVQILLENTEPNENTDPWAQSDQPIQCGSPVSSIISRNEPQIVENVDWSSDSLLCQTLAGYDTILAIPFMSDHLPMTWILLVGRGRGFFTTAYLEQALLRTSLIGALLESQMLAGKVAEAHELIDQEVRRVGEIQRGLLPNPLPRIPGLEIAASFETFGEAGGDLYDFVPLRSSESDPERWAIFLGDASGHGPSAAVVIAIVQALLHAHPPGITGPAALFRHINHHLCSRPIEFSFVTAFLCIYEPSSRQLMFSRAGHPPPFLVRRSPRTLQMLDGAAGCPLGIDPNEKFDEASVQLNSGDALLLYTDGIEESRDPSDNMFGTEGIEAAIPQTPASPDQVIAAIRQAVTHHVKGRLATDDQTILAISVV